MFSSELQLDVYLVATTIMREMSGLRDVTKDVAVKMQHITSSFAKTDVQPSANRGDVSLSLTPMMYVVRKRSAMCPQH